MKPLSERLKDFPNAQFVDWLCLACVDVREVRTPDDAQEEINKIRDAVTGRLASLMQRAEAAEAKMVPDGWVTCSPEWIERNGPCSCGAAPRIAFGDIGPHYHPKSFT